MGMFMSLAGKIIISFSSFKISLENPLTWIGIVFILALLWRWWGIKRVIGFGIIMSILLIFMFKIEGVIINNLGVEEGNPFALLIKPFFITLLVILFLCFSFLKKD